MKTMTFNEINHMHHRRLRSLSLALHASLGKLRRVAQCALLLVVPAAAVAQQPNPPLADAPAPLADAPAPLADAPAPLADAPAPRAEAPAPAEIQSQPVAPPEPVPPAPAAPVNQPAQVTETPAELPPAPADADAETASQPDADQIDAPEGLRFTFDRSPWRFVIDWLADEAGLAVHVGALPTGSFTYSDNRIYTPDEAIGRINLFLIPQRYSLVRTESLLSVISLDDEQSIRQLDAMAKPVNVSDLPKSGKHDVVKCFFPLGEIDSNAVLQELTGLMLMRDPVVLKNTNQLLLTDTAGKLMLVDKVIQSVANAMLDEEPPVARFSYGTLDPERVLAQIRPHVGLDPLASLGTDISLSIDRDGGQILASGTKEQLSAVASVIESLSLSKPNMQVASTTFQSHKLGDADMQTVVSVLQTLLADEDVRLAPDPKTNQLAVLGTTKVHEIVDTTVKQLAGDNKIEFKAIELGDIDPRYAVSVLSGMFNIQRPSAETTAKTKVVDPNAIKIEPDAYTQRLFVRGTAQQIAEIEAAVTQLDQSSRPTSDSNVRLLPYHGKRAEQIISSAAQFWPHDEKLTVLPPPSSNEPESIEREINPTAKIVPATPAKPNAKAQTRSNLPKISLATSRAGNAAARRSEPEIKIQWTPRGILVHSADGDAIRRFEEHVRLIAGPANESEMKLSVFYLKNVDADVASQLLQDILDAEYFGQLSDSPYNLGDTFGSLLSGAGGDTAGLSDYWTSGSTTVIPDKRLNRIFVYGTPEDTTSIEQHLSVIDRESSIAAVKTFGQPKMIRLEHADAEEVADVLRDAYAGRVAKTDKERKAAEERRVAAAAKTKSPLAKEPPSSQTSGPQMTIAVNEQTNSIVITAPEQLATEVEQLVRTIDEEATTATTVRTLSAAAPQVSELLQEMLGDKTRKSTAKKSSK